MKSLILALPLALTANAALADCASWSLGDLTVTKPWSRATMGAQRPGVFYVEIRNAGAAEDALTKIATPAAKTPMLHETVVKDGVASMIHAATRPGLSSGRATYRALCRKSAPQQRALSSSSGLMEIPKGQEKAGDLIFFGGKSITHVGMMINDHEFIHATTHDKPVVQISDLRDAYWQRIYQGCRRVPR